MCVYGHMLKKLWWRWENIFPLMLAIVNDPFYINYETFTWTSILIPGFQLLIASYAKR